MNVVTSLFSFQGRMRRRDFWICVLILFIANWILQAIVGAALGPTIMVSNPYNGMNWAVWTGMMRGMSLIWLILCWPSFAIAVKRCHDRDQTGWWSLLVFIPVIGWLWWLINLGILDGTPGPNQYGPSPKAWADPIPLSPADQA